MSQYDYETYPGGPESGPTLTRDVPAYGAELYVAKPPRTTAQQDMPATEELSGPEEKPVKKKKSRIGKALKLLASCVTAVAVVTTLTAPVKPVSGLGKWPGFGTVGGDGGFSFTIASQNSGTCQASIGGKAYRLTAKKSDLHLQWHESYDYSSDGSDGGFYVAMESLAERWVMILDFSTFPKEKMDEEEGLGQVRTASGETLNVRGFHIGSGEDHPAAQQIVSDLEQYIELSDATADGWGNVLIGNTMYSETNVHWNGIQTVCAGDEFGDIHIRWICKTANAPYSTKDFLGQYWTNDIMWDFYYSLDKGVMMIWVVPTQEDIALGFDMTERLHVRGIAPEMLEEMYIAGLSEEIVELTRDFVEGCIVRQGLVNYHLVEKMPERKPAVMPEGKDAEPPADAIGDTTR